MLHEGRQETACKIRYAFDGPRPVADSHRHTTNRMIERCKIWKERERENAGLSCISMIYADMCAIKDPNSQVVKWNRGEEGEASHTSIKHDDQFFNDLFQVEVQNPAYESELLRSTNFEVLL